MGLTPLRRSLKEFSTYLLIFLMTAPWDISYPSDNNYLTFLHCNVRSARNKEDELTIFLSEFRFKFHVIMISEKWYSCRDDVLNLPGYKSFFLNRAH